MVEGLKYGGMVCCFRLNVVLLLLDYGLSCMPWFKPIGTQAMHDLLSYFVSIIRALYAELK